MAPTGGTQRKDDRLEMIGVGDQPSGRPRDFYLVILSRFDFVAGQASGGVVGRVGSKL